MANRTNPEFSAHRIVLEWARANAEPSLTSDGAPPAQALLTPRTSSFLLLPATAQRLVKLYQGDQFIPLRLRQTELCGKSIRLVGQHFEVIRGSGLEAHLGELGRILGGLEQVLLLEAKFLILAVGGQSVR